MNITYTRKSDYLFPNLTIGPVEQVDIGKYGRLRKKFLKEHHPGFYSALLLDGRLTKHLLEIDCSAQAQVDLTVKQLLKAHPAPDRSVDFLGYVGHINNLTAMAEEAVLRDLVLA